MAEAAEFGERWAGLGSDLGCTSSEWAALGDDLRERHLEAGRAYHVVRHVEAVLAHLDELTGRRATSAQVLAAFFHDAVYDATRSDNEARSAQLAAGSLGRLGLDADIVADTCRIIEATAGHEATGEPSVEVFLDADLAILGAPPVVYDTYAADIAEEYRHMSAEDYRSGRRAVLDHFLERERIFATEGGRELFEEQARENLARERATL